VGTIHFSFRGRFGSLQKGSGRQFPQHLGGMFHQIKMSAIKKKKFCSSHPPKNSGLEKLKTSNSFKNSIEKTVKTKKISR
jgi:hypothetical protein